MKRSKGKNGKKEIIKSKIKNRAVIRVSVHLISFIKIYLFADIIECLIKRSKI